MTPTQMRRAAVEARKLASEIVDGTAPPMVSYEYCGCACGEVIARVVGENWMARYLRSDSVTLLACEIDMLLPDEAAKFPSGEGLVSSGLRADNPEGAVFPLLALADALEARANEAEDP